MQVHFYYENKLSFSVLYGTWFYKVNISRIVAMLNDTLHIYLLMIFKLTHILLNSEIEIPNKTILSF